MSAKTRRPRRLGPFARYFRCTDEGPNRRRVQAKPGCGAIQDFDEGSDYVCPICGAEGSYQPFVAREVFERLWLIEDRLVGYDLRDGGFIKLVRVSDVEVTREILS